ncbi:MAG: hypothetical protein IPM74_15975 [Crocinitomicaceae bacterium]|nr:hypothetical protein [Crocinitomicaceae bacterium]
MRTDNWKKFHWKENKVNGPITVYHNNGNLHYTGQYEMDLKQGTWTRYSYQGKKSGRKLCDNYEDGVWTRWYENGNVKQIQTYADSAWDRTIYQLL